MNSLFAMHKKDIKGILWLGIALFLALSLFSYYPQDPSFNSTSSKISEVKNFCGYFGSFLSDFLLQIFGLSSWVLVIGALRLSIMNFFNKSHTWNYFNYFSILLLLIICSCLLSLYGSNYNLYGGQILVGGNLGQIIKNYLIKFFNILGVSIILWSCALALIIYYTKKPLKYFFIIPGSILKKVLTYLFGIPFVVFSFFKNKKYLKLKKTKRDLRKIKNYYSLKKQENEFNCSNKKNENYNEDINKKNLDINKNILYQPNEESEKKENWVLPKLDFLNNSPLVPIRQSEKEIKRKAEILVNKLSQFAVKGEVTAVKTGPVVTLFEFKPEVDVPISKITKLENDLSLALSSESVRIIAPIPGRDVVGIETSNLVRETVYLKEIVKEKKFWQRDIALPVPLGRKVNGESEIVDLRKMPHLLVAGSTGSGKSVFTVSTICGLLCRHSPNNLRFVIIDPKQVDLVIFDRVPHLIMPIISDIKKSVVALKWTVDEMEKRYLSLKKFGVRKIEEFNSIVSKISHQEFIEHKEQNILFEQNLQKKETYYFEPLPYIVLIIEEFSDLMSVDRQNIEHYVVRLAQKARAAGIHLFLSMQSPRKDVLTGLIKTNIPGRISFKVASKMDSRIILDDSGAERLLARGDMLFLSPGVSKSVRHHGPWVSDDEVNKIVDFWFAQSEPRFDYDRNMLSLLENPSSYNDYMNEERETKNTSSMDNLENYADERYDEILAHVSEMEEISASMLQRRFRLGYPRAARMIEIFEKEGVVGPAQGSKPRKVLINSYKNGNDIIYNSNFNSRDKNLYKEEEYYRNDNLEKNT